jgi:hypothetical protein
MSRRYVLLGTYIIISPVIFYVGHVAFHSLGAIVAQNLRLAHAFNGLSLSQM